MAIDRRAYFWNDRPEFKLIPGQDMSQKSVSEHTSLPRARKTRIVATLGPASTSREEIERLFLAGVDVFRLNFSHGTHEDHKARYDVIRQIEKDLGHPIGIMADMQGPKLRVGKFKDGKIALTIGQTLRFDLSDEPGDEKRVQLPHPEIIRAMNVGDRMLMDDGKVQTIVREKGDSHLIVEVTGGNALSNNKGVNVPGVILPIPALTDKDRRDLAYALSIGVDFIAQSFVQKPEDVAEAKKLISADPSGNRAKLIVKLEKPSAIDKLDEIVTLTDAVMVARGDLGVEIPPEQVPGVQKRIVRLCRKLGKPCIVATQMLESMITAPTPTRAEASDVATAIYDGTDAVMLSAETASGQYPLEAVTIMDRIAKSIENDTYYRTIMDAEHPETARDDASDAITAAAHHIAFDVHAAAIVNFTATGSSVLRTARQRPFVPILCLTENEKTARQLCLSYAVHPVVTHDVQSFDDMVSRASRYAREEKLAQKGQRIVITAGVPFGTPGSTNVLRIAWVD